MRYIWKNIQNGPNRLKWWPFHHFKFYSALKIIYKPGWCWCRAPPCCATQRETGSPTHLLFKSQMGTLSTQRLERLPPHLQVGWAPWLFRLGWPLWLFRLGWAPWLFRLGWASWLFTLGRAPWLLTAYLLKFLRLRRLEKEKCLHDYLYCTLQIWLMLLWQFYKWSKGDLKQNVAAADVVLSNLKGIANTDIRQFWVRTGPDYNRRITDP